MIHNRYKQDLLASRKECLEFKHMAIEANDAESAAGFDLLIADYTEMLKNADTIPLHKKLYYKVQEVIDKIK